MDKQRSIDSEQDQNPKVVSLKTKIVLVTLILILFSGVSITVAQITQMMMQPDDVFSVSCNGRGIKIESISRQKMNVICQPEDTVLTPSATPIEPTASPPAQPTVTPQSPVLGDYYVSPDGNDSNEGTIDQPFRTIQYAVSRAQAGDVVYVREGMYAEVVNIRNSGQPGQPLTVAAYPGERPIIDGRFQLPTPPSSGWPVCNNTVSPAICMHYGPLVSIEGNYIVFAGFNVTGSNGRGIRVWRYNDRPHHIELRDNYVYENRGSAIFTLAADHVLVEGNQVWHNVNFATHDRSPAELNWPHAVIALESTNVVYRGNLVYQNWGEGIGAGTSSVGVVIEDNEIFDNKVQIYVHRSQNVIVQRNLVYCTSDPAYNRGGSPPPGIAVNNEEQFSGELTVDAVNIVNNIVAGCQVNFGVWTGTGIEKLGVRNVLFAHNTVVNAVTSPDDTDIPLGISISSGPHSGIEIKNNIILQSTGAIAYVGGSGSGITLSNNLWSRTPPITAQGPGDIIADPMLVNPNAQIVANMVAPEWYMTQPYSEAINNASVVNIVEDFFGNVRDIQPDIGAYELMNQ